MSISSCKLHFKGQLFSMKNLLQLFLKVECKFNWKCQINIKYTTDSNQMINKLNTWKLVLN